MTKRFVIGTETLSPEQQASLLSYIKDNGLAWWHWLPNFWLIKDPKEKITANSLTEALGSAECLVMEIDEDIHWVCRMSPNASGKKPSHWLKNVWKD